VKVNNVNLFLSIIFFKSSCILIPNRGKVSINSLGLNSTIIEINTTTPYWGMYFSHIIYILNRERLSYGTNSGKKNSISSKKPFIKDSNSRSYSSSTSRYDSNLIND
jgi:hypothetical protein